MVVCDICASFIGHDGICALCWHRRNFCQVCGHFRARGGISKGTALLNHLEYCDSPFPMQTCSSHGFVFPLFYPTSCADCFNKRRNRFICTDNVHRFSDCCVCGATCRKRVFEAYPKVGLLAVCPDCARVLIRTNISSFLPAAVFGILWQFLGHKR